MSVVSSIHHSNCSDIDLSGPVISAAAKQRILGLIASAKEQGGIIKLDGSNYEVPGYPDGNWVGPTVIEATTDMRCYRCGFRFSFILVH